MPSIKKCLCSPRLSVRKMRTQFLKLKRGKSTKAERIFGEILKSNRIPFRAKVKVNNREVDFLIQDRFIVELNGHEQDSERNSEFVKLGYVPVHFSNAELINNRETIKTKIICLLEQD